MQARIRKSGSAPIRRGSFTKRMDDGGSHPLPMAQVTPLKQWWSERGQRTGAQRQAASERLEQELRSQSPADWLDRLCAASRNILDHTMLLLMRFASPQELGELFRLAAEDSRAQASASLQQGLNGWRQTLLTLTPDLFSAQPLFRRTEIQQAPGHSLLHYTLRADAVADPSSGRGLVIGTHGRAGMLMAPTACILNVLAAMQHDLLIVRWDPCSGGLDQDSALIEAIEHHLRQAFAAELPRAVSLGTSAGALPSLALALRLGLKRAVAVAASPAQRLQLLDDALGCWNVDQPGELLLTASAGNHTDRQTAETLRDHLQARRPDQLKVHCHLFEGCSLHAPFKELASRGVTLDAVLPRLLLDPLADLSDSGPDRVLRRPSVA